MKNDIALIRELAKNYIEICSKDVQVSRRDLWRNHNSFKFSRPPIYVRAYAWQEMKESALQCEDPFWHWLENFFRCSLFQHKFNDDIIFEPWVNFQVYYRTPVPANGWEWGGLWGLPVKWVQSENNPAGAKHWIPPLKDPDNISKLKVPAHEIDEERTAREVEILQEAVGDIIPVNIMRSPALRMWHGDISTELAQLRGLEQIMWDMLDRPEWLKELLAFMRDGILKTHAEAESINDWGLADHQNQAMPYSLETDDPKANCRGAAMKDLWYYCASQELTLVGPDQFNEFMLEYQIPIMEKFGLVAYGCCEDLTRKIDLLRKIPNLRRIAVSPFADVKKCAEQIGADYVISYRPSPADMVGYGFDPDKIKNILRKDFEALKGTCFDITLKDVETVQGDQKRIQKWVQIVREVIDEFEW